MTISQDSTMTKIGMTQIINSESKSCCHDDVTISQNKTMAEGDLRQV